VDADNWNMAPPRRLHVEGSLKVVEQSGLWGVYTGERIMLGSGDSFRDDLGVRIRETFQDGARDALADGRQPSEAFSLPRVRVTIELIDDAASPPFTGS
jgi:hypothetical protein